MSLNPCKQCGAPAVEQVRGRMGPGDYKEMQILNRKGRMVDNPDFYKDVWLDDSNRDDFRISCSVCDNATPWNKPDAPNMPGVGIGFTRDLWTKLNPAA